MLKRHYEAAEKSALTDGWRHPSTDPNQEVEGNLGILRDRSRDAYRNVSWIRKGIRTIERHTVGAGFSAEITAIDDSDRAKRSAEALRVLWDDHFTRNDNPSGFDADGRLNYVAGSRMVVRTAATAGEVLMRRRRIRLSPGVRVPLRMQFLEPDFIDESQHQVDRTASRTVRDIQGVRFTNGHRSGYWLFDEHPGSMFGSLTSRLVSADGISHIFESIRANQARGRILATASLRPTKDLRDYGDAQISRQQVAALFAAFTKGGNTLQADDQGQQRLAPASIVPLGDTEEVMFSDPPKVEGYSEFVDTELRSAAAGIGVAFEQLSGNYSQVNFASARLALMEAWGEFSTWQTDTLIPHFAGPLWRWFVNAAVLAASARGEPEIFPELVSVEWTCPVRPMIEPDREIAAMKDAIRSGLSPLSAELRKRGLNPRRALEQMRKDNELIDEMELVLDSDPRKVGAAGASSTPSSAPKDNDGSKGDSDPDDSEPEDSSRNGRGVGVARV